MFVLVGMAGAITGAVALSILTIALSAIPEPDTFGEGQFAVGLAFTVAEGMLLGGIISLAARQARRGHRTRAG